MGVPLGLGLLSGFGVSSVKPSPKPSGAILQIRRLLGAAREAMAADNQHGKWRGGREGVGGAVGAPDKPAWRRR